MSTPVMVGNISLFQNFDTAGAFRCLPADILDPVAPSIVECAVPDESRDLDDGAFTMRCREKRMRRTYTTRDTPTTKGIAKQGVNPMTHQASQAACLDAP